MWLVVPCARCGLEEAFVAGTQPTQGCGSSPVVAKGLMSPEESILEASYKGDLEMVQRLVGENPALANLRGQPER